MKGARIEPFKHSNRQGLGPFSRQAKPGNSVPSWTLLDYSIGEGGRNYPPELGFKNAKKPAGGGKPHPRAWKVLAPHL